NAFPVSHSPYPGVHLTGPGDCNTIPSGFARTGQRGPDAASAKSHALTAPPPPAALPAATEPVRPRCLSRPPLPPSRAAPAGAAPAGTYQAGDRNRQPRPRWMDPPGPQEPAAPARG